MIAISTIASAQTTPTMSAIVEIVDLRIHHRNGTKPTLLVVTAQNVHQCSNPEHFEMYDEGETDNIFEFTYSGLMWAMATGQSIRVYYDSDPATCYLGANAMLLGFRATN